MSLIRLTPAAGQDLSAIWDFTQEHWGANQAEIYISELRTAMERVAEDPRRGQTCDSLRINYRRYAVGRHLIFYVESEQGIDVIRVLHQRMDPTLHL